MGVLWNIVGGPFDLCLGSLCGCGVALLLGVEARFLSVNFSKRTVSGSAFYLLKLLLGTCESVVSLFGLLHSEWGIPQLGLLVRVGFPC